MFITKLYIHLLTVAWRNKDVMFSRMIFCGIYHIDPTLMQLGGTFKPPTLEDVGVEGSEIYLEDPFNASTIPCLSSFCVEVTHDSAIICGSTFIYFASTKMSTLRPYGIE